MIDETRSRIPVWLLWVTSTNGLVTLVAVALTQRRAMTYREVILQDENVVLCRIEPSEANHLFNPDWDTAWTAMFGVDYLTEYARQATGVQEQVIKNLRHELAQCRADLRRAGIVIEKLRDGQQNNSHS